jgi:hypothetical protein
VARNAGIRLARAPIVAFLDSDDRWRPNHLGVVAQTFVRYLEAVLVCTRPRFLVTGRRHPRAARLLDALPLLLVENFVGPPSSVAVRKTALAEVGGFDEALAVSEGRELWLRLATRGPFCILERRTIIVQVTRGSISDLGRSSRGHAPADEFIATKIAAEVARLDRPDSGDLTARARGRLRYAAALRGLVSHDDEAVSCALEEACGLLPELSREAYLVARRIMFIASDRGERLHHLTAAAVLWPEPHADTALFLRGTAILLALRMFRPRTAIRLAVRWPIAATPGFLARTLPMWIRVAEWVTVGWTHRGRQPASGRTGASSAR